MRQSEHLKTLFRPALAKPRGNDYLSLEKNEPPFSAFERLDSVLTDDDLRNLRAYPNLYSLYEKLAKFSGVAIENLLLTQGSEQAIKNIFDVFVQEGDEVVYYNPSFAMYDVFSYQRRARVKHLQFDERGRMSVPEILAAVTTNTRLFSIINPHNFTGTFLEIDAIAKIVEHTKSTNTIFLLDEAYYHYYNTDSVELIKRHEHVVITRTFSKALGIPGARVGYALASESIIELLRKVKPIDDIDYLGGVIAEKALDHAEEILARNVSQVKKWQQKFKNANLPRMSYIDTHANYVLLRSSDYSAHKKMFADNKIIPKLDFDVPCLKDCIRFSVADDVSMQKIMDLLTDKDEK